MARVGDGKWGVHGSVPKAICDAADRRAECVDDDEPGFELGDKSGGDEPGDEPSRATALPSVPMLMVLIASSVTFL